MEIWTLIAGIAAGVSLFKGFDYIKNSEARENEKRIYQLVERSKDIIYYCETKPQLRFRYLSPSIDSILGSGVQVRSMVNAWTSIDLLHPDDRELLDRKLSGKLDYSQPIIQRWKDDEGNYKYFEEFATPIFKNGEMTAIQGVIRNIDEKMRLQEELIYKAHHDGLSGLYNRLFFETQSTELDEENDIPVALLLCDLDELKYYNDTHGHRTGDELIKETSKILRSLQSDEVLIARIGGDEFAVLIKDTEKHPPEELKKTIHQKIANYNRFSKRIKIMLSIGISSSMTSLGKMNELYTSADQNMYEEKRRRKKSFS
ncbi:sensor domain-containing diguanylate cyclase [Bacillus sp. P14.5]|uniref:sensor domain-containing diguanylate cyclase n=1 Tax=Bacillus sp. P14.5 TaxID=1983400 RepID=UPI000DEB3418|nr:sensor domain-containing diguanylate cyclase [Bacillus sp. P14.5]